MINQGRIVRSGMVWPRWWIRGRIFRGQKIRRLTIVPAALAEDLLGVPSAQQAQTLGRCSIFHFMPSTFTPALLEVSQGQSVFSHSHQLAHEQANHAIQESTGLDLDMDYISRALNANVLNRGAGVCASTAGALKRCEVVAAKQALQRLLHHLFIKPRLVAMPAPRCKKQVGATTVVNGVAIAPVTRGIAGMPVERSLHCLTHSDRTRQSPVQRWCPSARGDGTTAIEVDHLSSGMNSGIGATGGHAVHRPEGIQGCDRVIKDALNAGALTLPLPAAKKRPLVLKAEGNPSWTIADRFSQGVCDGAL